MPVRAGSIGWDISVHGVLTEPPPEEAEGVSPAPSTEKSAPHGSPPKAETGLASRPWASLALTPNLSSSDLGHPPVTEGFNRKPAQPEPERYSWGDLEKMRAK